MLPITLALAGFALAAAGGTGAIIVAFAFLFALGLSTAALLAAANKVFYVKEDPKVVAIESCLPGANCGGCGFAGCSGCAAAIAKGKAPPNACVAGGNDVALAVAKVLGMEVSLSEPKVATPDCTGGVRAVEKYAYEGAEDCRAQMLLFEGSKVCPVGCLGLGSCVKACPFDAIGMGPDGYPVVSLSNCRSCGKCVEACPRGVIDLFNNTAAILHVNENDDCLAPCRQKCPAQIDIPKYIKHIRNGEFEDAIRTLKLRNPLILSCGRVCPHPCEDECRRRLADDPVGINYLKRYVADWEMGTGRHVEIPIAPETGKRVAVVGGGPAGLSAAFFLRRLGHKPVIFDMMPKLGGMIRYGIPEYRLPKKTLDWEIQGLLDLGIEARVNTRFGKDFTVESLRKDGFDAVFLGIGAWVSSAMRVKNENSPGVLGGIDFLNKVGLGEKVELGDTVVVVGGGNTAIDAVRTSLRLGVKRVILMYRRTRKEMPANEVEIVASEHEKIEFMFLCAPIGIVTGPDGKLAAIEYERMELGEPDASGRRKPVPVPDSKTQIPCTTVIAAIGQAPDPSCFDADGPETRVEITKWSTVVTNEVTCQSKIPYVFAAGDVQTGPSLVVTAIGGGRRAARGIHYYLMQDQIPVPENLQNQPIPISLLKDLEGVGRHGRVTMPELPVAERVNNMREVDLVLPRKDAKHEANRCMNCGLICYDKDSARNF